jgi:kinetochore protein Mis13/DSN1
MNRTITHAVGGLENPMTSADPKPPGKRKAVDDVNPLIQAVKRPKVCCSINVCTLFIE